MDFMSHSIRFPLPLSIHIGFVAVSVILLLLCYLKKKHSYELLMIVGILSTLLIYVSNSLPYFYVLGAEEIIIFIMICIDMHKVNKAQELAEKERDKAKKAAQEQADLDVSDDSADSAAGAAENADNDDKDDEGRSDR